jgi:hypothetical protein
VILLSSVLVVKPVTAQDEEENTPVVLFFASIADKM